MNKFNYTLAFIIILFFTSNAQTLPQSKIIKWSLQKEIIFTIKNKDNIPLFTQSVYKNGIPYLMFYNVASKKLLKYNLQTDSLVDSIFINILPANDIWAIKYISEDTIFILYNASQNKGYNHSGTLIRINSDGQLKQKFNLNEFPVKCDECSEISKNALAYITSKYGELPFSNNKLFVQFESYYYNPGDSEYINTNYPVFGYVDISENKSHILPIYIPKTDVGKHYAKRIKVPSITTNQEGNLVCSYNISSTLYIHDIKTKKTNSFHIPSFWPDSVLALDTSVFKSIPQDDYTQISPRNIFYNPYGKYYIRFSCLPLPKNASPEDRRNPDYLMSVIDEQFKLIAEGILPKNLSPICYFTEKSIGFWDKDKSPFRNSDKIHFTEYNLSFTRGTKQVLMSQMRKRDSLKIRLGIEEYLKNNFKIPYEKSVVFFIPLNSCKACVNSAVKYFSELKEDYPIFMVLGAENADKINGSLSSFHFNNESKIWKDSTLKYEKYLDPPILNCIIVFFESGKKVKEIKLIPGSLSQIIDETKSFLLIKK